MNYLCGKQVRLRAVEPEDLDLLYRWENDSSLWACGSTLAPFSRHLLRQYIENYSADIARDNQLRLMIDLQETGETIGILDCFEYDAQHRKAALGILIDPQFQRQGLGREAVSLFVNYAFHTLHLHQLYAHIPCGNTASLALFRACGFRESARLCDWLLLPQGYSDALLLQRFNTESHIN